MLVDGVQALVSLVNSTLVRTVILPIVSASAASQLRSVLAGRKVEDRVVVTSELLRQHLKDLLALVALLNTSLAASDVKRVRFVLELLRSEMEWFARGTGVLERLTDVEETRRILLGMFDRVKAERAALGAPLGAKGEAMVRYWIGQLCSEVAPEGGSEPEEGSEPGFQRGYGVGGYL